MGGYASGFWGSVSESNATASSGAITRMARSSQPGVVLVLSTAGGLSVSKSEGALDARVDLGLEPVGERADWLLQNVLVDGGDLSDVDD